MAHITATQIAQYGTTPQRHFELHIDFDTADFENSSETFMLDGEEISRQDIPQRVFNRLYQAARKELQALGVKV